MRQFKSQKRIEKITRVLSLRQPTLNVVLENIHDPHNVSAIFRTCDAVGVPKVSLLYNVEPFPRIGKKSSASAFKWVDKERFTTVDDCYSSLRNKGFKIYTTALDENAVSLFDLDFTEDVAIVMGNEHRGASEEAMKQADRTFYIPMLGMVQSLNVSVATAVVLYEVLRQREIKGMYKDSCYDEKQLQELIDNWCDK